MTTKLSEEKFAPRFGDWWPKIRPFFISGGFDEIYRVLKKESGSGIRIAPDSGDVFRAFILTPINQLRVVVCGLCPYHTPGVADGLALSCSKTGRLQPSLEKLYEAWETEFHYGLCLECDRNPDLEYLAKQGVLLFNAALTTRVGEAKAHQELWAPFTKYVLEEIVSLTGVPVLFLGKEAATFSGCLAPMQHHFELSHPAYASYRKERWDSKGVFSQMNRIVEDSNGETIHWMLPIDVPF